MSRIADLIIHNGRIVHPDSIVPRQHRHPRRPHPGDRRARRHAARRAKRSTPGACTCCRARSTSTCISAIPAITHKEDWDSGTAAAAFGGVTTVFDMPNTVPAVGDCRALAEKHAIASSRARVDYGLYGFLGEDTIANVPDMIAGGVIGFKLYMGETFGTFADAVHRRDAGGVRGCRANRQTHFPPCRNRIDHGAAGGRMRDAGRTDPLAHLAARPAIVAVEAVGRAAVLAEWTGARIHVLHISSAEELRPLGGREGARCRYHRRNLPALFVSFGR